MILWQKQMKMPYVPNNTWNTNCWQILKGKLNTKEMKMLFLIKLSVTHQKKTKNPTVMEHSEALVHTNYVIFIITCCPPINTALSAHW